MKSIKIAGLCLVAVFAFSAIAAASASAKPSIPHFEKCVKAEKVEGKYTGEFSDKDCTKEVADGEYRLKRVEGETPKFTLKSKGATFTVDGKEVKCTKGAGGGELEANGWAEETVTITFSKCDVNNNKNEPCANIAIAANGGELYYTSKENTEAELALGVKPVEIKCGSETFKVEHHVIGAVKNSKTGETITFEAPGGKQALQYEWIEEEQVNTFPEHLESNGSEVTLKAVLEQKGPKGVGVFF